MTAHLDHAPPPRPAQDPPPLPDLTPAPAYRAPAVLALPLFAGILVAASACVFGFGGIQFLGALTATVCAAVWAWDAWLSPDRGGRS